MSERRIVATGEKGRYIFQAIVYPEGTGYGWRVDKVAANTTVGAGSTPISSAAPVASAEEAEKAVRAALAEVLRTEKP